MLTILEITDNHGSNQPRHIHKSYTQIIRRTRRIVDIYVVIVIGITEIKNNLKKHTQIIHTYTQNTQTRTNLLYIKITDNTETLKKK